jgi:hypothetical protein
LDPADYRDYARRAQHRASAAYEYAKPKLKIGWLWTQRRWGDVKFGWGWLRERTNTDRILATATVVIMIATIAGAASTYLQWKELRSSSEQVERSIAATTKIANAGIEANQLNKATSVANTRAWVGPTDANITPPILFAPLKGIVIFSNTGHQPAATNASMIPTVYSATDWDGGKAAVDIEKYADQCVRSPIGDLGIRMIFPTSGFTSYNLGYDGTQKDLHDVGKISVTEGIVAGTQIVTFKGCIIYRTVNEIHHTAFCYFYRAKSADPAHLFYCTVGQTAD